jgi:hypothetical protein
MCLSTASLAISEQRAVVALKARHHHIVHCAGVDCFLQCLLVKYGFEGTDDFVAYVGIEIVRGCVKLSDILMSCGCGVEKVEGRGSIENSTAIEGGEAADLAHLNVVRTSANNWAFAMSRA